MIDDDDDNRELALPAWAQSALRTLREQLKAQQEELDVHHHQVGPTGVELVRYTTGNIYLPDGVIRFHLDHGDYIEIKREEGGPGVELRGSTSLSVNPRMATKVSVELRR